MRFVILAMTDQNDASVNLAVARLINPLFPLEDPLVQNHQKSNRSNQIV